MVDGSMIQDYACKLLISHEFRDSLETKLDKGLLKNLEIEYYRTPNLVTVDPIYPIQIILLSETDYPDWSQRKIPTDCILGVILLESREGKLIPDPESNLILTWMNVSTISSRRLNYLIHQGFTRLARKRLRAEMKVRIDHHNQQLSELNEIGMLLSSEKDLKKLLKKVSNFSRFLATYLQSNKKTLSNHSYHVRAY